MRKSLAQITRCAEHDGEQARAMLIDFRLENHRSIRSEATLTMESTGVGDRVDPRLRQPPGHAGAVLPVAAIYGANASGKSNVLSGIAFMREAFLHSHRSWPPEGVARDPFAWGSTTSDPSMYEVTFVAEGVRYQYGFVANDEKFLEEWLFAWPKGRKQVWLAREGQSFKFGEHFIGENRMVEQVTRPNALFLAAAVQHSHTRAWPIYRWFRDLRTVNVRAPVRRGFNRESVVSERWFLRALEASSGDQQSLFEDDQFGEDYLEAFRGLLKSADVGILDFRVREVNDEDSRRPGRSRIDVRHQSTLGEAWLPLDQESQGTLTLFRIGPPLLETLRRGGLLVVDELEASLHPLLALRIVQQFNDPQANPRNAQLVFTTHDTTLLGTTISGAPLRRDQVWLTEKDPDGATCLYPLTNYKPRKAENLERGYLQGRYGAIPFLSDLVRPEE